MHSQHLSARIRPSAVLGVALVLMHGAATVCAVVFIPYRGLAGAVAAAVAVSLAFALRQHALLVGRKAIIELILHDGPRCELVLANGDRLAGTIDNSTFVAPWLTVINLRTDAGQRRAIVLAPDSAPAEIRRRLRVWLRHRVRPDDPGSRPS